jgi:hypothetical protein
MRAAITFNEKELTPVSFWPDKADDSPFWSFLRNMGYSDFELAVVKHFKSYVTLIILAAKNKGMRFEVSDAVNDEIISLNDDVVILISR